MYHKEFQVKQFDYLRMSYKMLVNYTIHNDLVLYFYKINSLTVTSRSVIIPRSTLTSKRCKAYCEPKAIQTRS